MTKGRELVVELMAAMKSIKDAGRTPTKVYIGPDEDHAISEYLTEAGAQFGGGPITTLDGGKFFLLPVVVSPDVRLLVV